jgi:hypothetical protein
MKASMRCVAVAITICSWFSISNHCAFAAMARKTNSAQAACPFHSKPEKQKERSSQVQCCKSLRAVVFGKTKTWTRDDSNFSKVELYADEQVCTPCSSRSRVPLLLDTGPPEAWSFAELTLQRSLLAHAPPSLA